MIVLERRLKGLLHYTTAFFATPGEVETVLGDGGSFDLMRFFWIVGELPASYSPVKTELSTTVWIDLQEPIDSLWGGISKNGRNEIRNVERLADRVVVKRNSADTVNDFLAMFNSFARVKDGVSPISHAVLKRYLEHADVFVAYLDDEPLCGHVYLRDRRVGRARLLYSASRRLDDPALSRQCGHLNRFLHWRDIATYRDEGFSTYDFGGIRREPGDGIARFKQSFGGRLIDESTVLYTSSFIFTRMARYFVGARTA